MMLTDLKRYFQKLMGRQVKILMLSWEFPPLVAGGLGRHVAELAPALAELGGIDVHVMVPYPGSARECDEFTPNITLHWVNTSQVDPNLNIYERACQINELMDAAAAKLWKDVGGFDLIHAHDWLVGFAAIELKLAHKCPLIVTIHATERGRWRNMALPNDLSRQIDSVERNLTFEAWRVIACSQYMIRELNLFFSLPMDKMDMIPNGISLKNVAQLPDDILTQFRLKYAGPNQPLIFSVGRIVYEKGYQVLIGAMPQILAEFPDARLVLAGKGPLLDQLQHLAQDMGVGNHVHFAGFISDTERDMLYSVADVAVFPSLYEPFGIVALEAIALNCPVIVSQVGGLAEVIEHGRTGTMIFPDNVDSAAWGVLHVLRNPELAASCAANATLMLEEKYSWSRIAQQTQHVYRQILLERAKTTW